MFWVIYSLVYILSYLFGSFAFPQIVGSIRMIRNGIKTPYTFTLILWSSICIIVTFLIYAFMREYFITYLIVLMVPLIITLRIKNIE